MLLAELSARTLRLSAASIAFVTLLLATGCNSPEAGARKPPIKKSHRNPTVAEFFRESKESKREARELERQMDGSGSVDPRDEFVTTGDEAVLTDEELAELAALPPGPAETRRAQKAAREASENRQYSGPTGERGFCPQCGAVHFGDSYCGVCQAPLGGR